jgi:hypothetical protein
MGFDSDSFDTNAFDAESFDFGAASTPPVIRPGRRPRVRTISIRALVFAIDGNEQPYPVYRFARRRFLERPHHNPFVDA